MKQSANTGLRWCGRRENNLKNALQAAENMNKQGALILCQQIPAYCGVLRSHRPNPCLGLGAPCGIEAPEDKNLQVLALRALQARRHRQKGRTMKQGLNGFYDVLGWDRNE